jgi:hypothetical protein
MAASIMSSHLHNHRQGCKLRQHAADLQVVECHAQASIRDSHLQEKLRPARKVGVSLSTHKVKEMAAFSAAEAQLPAAVTPQSGTFAAT